MIEEDRVAHLVVHELLDMPIIPQSCIDMCITHQSRISLRLEIGYELAVRCRRVAAQSFLYGVLVCVSRCFGPLYLLRQNILAFLNI